ncbi:SbcC/MukB-like Walker B domain-containing protein [Salinisphaera hydrothermalis]|uniref:SMC domain-containing protein n=1 Tax=Salinisphaera hydrothermalis (strain C41B8) TaxID=1304275 RepID=A0A084IM96_SALHC|nr:SbcC/MukB-like Walker B domain-containing protein [Salinisphaera hydrothermalis]KEZ77830.1 hypothetical protein C41B8_08440 [Salinisphaera hydrothermalis C41B8]
MKRLSRINLVQFHVYEKEQIEIAGNTAILGDNGSGKSTILDAIQLVMTGGHGNYRSFNAQSSSSSASKRTIRSYLLGTLESKSQDGSVDEVLVRDEAAYSYITLTFWDTKRETPFTAGICASASQSQSDHTVHGLFLLPGVALEANDLTEYTAAGELPLAWKDFEARANKRCRDAGRTLIVKDGAEAYVKALLTQLGSGRARIDERSYLRAFTKALQLRDIDGVDKFVRQHIVPTGDIDVAEFGIQIQQFNELRALIASTRQNIEELGRIEERYGRAERAIERHASLMGLAAEYDYEAAAEAESDAQDQLTLHADTFEAANKHAGQAELKLGTIRPEFEALDQECRTRPELADRAKDEKDAERARRNCKRTQEQINVRLRAQAEGLTHLAQHESNDEHRSRLRRVARGLHDARTDLENTNRDRLLEHVVDAAGLLKTSIKTLRADLGDATSKRQDAQSRLKEAKERLAAMESSGSLLGHNSSRAANLFRDKGIPASPICSLLRVTDPAWQPAIEAYLGGQLEDFVVHDDREAEAVRAIREVPAHEAIYDVRVAQPRHLQQHRDRTPGPDDVARLIESDNWIALAYVRASMRNVRFAIGEADLSRHTRALSQDGMVSSGGGTARKRLPPKGQLRIGVRVDEEELAEATREISRLHTIFSEAEQAERRLSRLIDQIESGTSDQAKAEVLQDLEQFSSDTEELRLLEDRLSAAPSQSAQELRERRDAKKKELDTVDKQLQEAQKEASVAEANIKHTNERVQTCVSARQECQRMVDQAQAEPFFDAQLADSERQRIDTELGNVQAPTRPGGETDHAARARELAAHAQGVHDRAVTEARDELLGYTARTEMDCPPLRTGWRPEAEDALDDDFSADSDEALKSWPTAWQACMHWARREKQILESSKLVDQKARADSALTEAKNAFRRDIAYKLNEQMQLMKTRLHEMNRMLKSCKPFSQGERYQFSYKARPEHADLRRFIEHVGQAGEDELPFGDEEAGASAHAAMERLIEMAEQGLLSDDTAPTVLTDYREFYAFDLEIRVNDKIVNLLSNRTGGGSGGEHRTPFYVIAGASLARAYRLDEAEDDGGGLMLLDEAFYSMDQQNSTAAVEFLSQRGLQLIMAAPETDRSKISATCDTVMDIGREGTTPWMHITHVKSAARELLASDDPHQQPDLLEVETRRVENEQSRQTTQ